MRPYAFVLAVSVAAHVPPVQSQERDCAAHLCASHEHIDGIMLLMGTQPHTVTSHARLRHAPHAEKMGFSRDGGVLWSLASSLRGWSTRDGSLLHSVAIPQGIADFALIERTSPLVLTVDLSASDSEERRAMVALPHLRLWSLEQGRQVANTPLAVSADLLLDRNPRIATSKDGRTAAVIYRTISELKEYWNLMVVETDTLEVIQIHCRLPLPPNCDFVVTREFTSTLHFYDDGAVYAVNPTSGEMMYQHSLRETLMQGEYLIGVHADEAVDQAACNSSDMVRAVLCRRTDAGGEMRDEYRIASLYSAQGNKPHSHGNIHEVDPDQGAPVVFNGDEYLCYSDSLSDPFTFYRRAYGSDRHYPAVDLTYEPYAPPYEHHPAARLSNPSVGLQLSTAIWSRDRNQLAFAFQGDSRIHLYRVPQKLRVGNWSSPVIDISAVASERHTVVASALESTNTIVAISSGGRWSTEELPGPVTVSDVALSNCGRICTISGDSVFVWSVHDRKLLAWLAHAVPLSGSAYRQATADIIAVDVLGSVLTAQTQRHPGGSSQFTAEGAVGFPKLFDHDPDFRGSRFLMKQARHKLFSIADSGEMFVLAMSAYSSDVPSITPFPDVDSVHIRSIDVSIDSSPIDPAIDASGVIGWFDSRTFLSPKYVRPSFAADRIRLMELSPDGSRLAVLLSSNTINVVDVSSKLLYAVDIGDDLVSGVAFSRDSKYLAWVSESGSVEVVNYGDASKRFKIQAPYSQCTAVALDVDSSGSTVIAVGTADGVTVVYDRLSSSCRLAPTHTP